MIFPKNIPLVSRSAFRWLSVCFLISLLGVGSLLRLYIHKKMESHPVWVPEFFNPIDQALIHAFWILTVVTLGLGLLFVRYFLSPLGVLITKARDINEERYGTKKHCCH